MSVFSKEWAGWGVRIRTLWCAEADVDGKIAREFLENIALEYSNVCSFTRFFNRLPSL